MVTNIRVEFGGIKGRKRKEREEANWRGRKNWIERERERNKKGDFLGISTVEARRFEKKSPPF